MSEHVLSILVKALGASKAAKELKGVDAAIASIGSRAGKGLRTTASNIQRLGVVAAGVAATGLVLAVKSAADFESQLNTINTIAKATPAQLDAIGASLRKVARDTGVSLDDLTQGYYDLLSAGVKTADAQGVLNAAVTLGIGGLATTSQTIDLLTTALNVYGGGAKEAAQYADYFAQAIAAGKVTAAEIAESFANVAPLAKSAGISIQELAAGYAQLTAKGETGASASTSMAAAILALQRKTADLVKVEKKLGVNFADIAKKQGLAKAYAMMRAAAEKYNIPLIKLVGRQEALAYAFDVTKENAAAYAKNLTDVQRASGEAAAQAAERQKGLNYQLSRLKAYARDAGITIGSKLLPKLTPLAEKAVAFLETHQSDIDAFGDSIAGAFDKAAEFAQKVPWGTIGSGLKTAAEWASRLMDVFLALPPELQTTIVALAGLNKLSGGAVSGVASEIGKGLIKGVLGMNAGVVNIKAGVVNGGAAGGVGAVGGGGSKLGRVTSALSKVFIIGAAVGVFAELKGILDSQSAANAQASQDLISHAATYAADAKTNAADIRNSINAVDAKLSEAHTTLSADGIAIYYNIDHVRDTLEATKAQLNAGLVATVAAESRTTTAAEHIRSGLNFVADRSTNDAERIRGAVTTSGSTSAAHVAGAVVTAGLVAKAGGLAAAAAIAAKNLSMTAIFKPTIITSVSVRETINTRTTYKQYSKTVAS